MKSEEFYSLFPRANVKHFKEDSDNNVLFDEKAIFSPNDILDDVGEPAFWQGKGALFLGLSKKDLELWKKDKLNFLKKYREEHKYKKDTFDSDVSFSIPKINIWEPEEWGFNSDKIIPEIELKNYNINFEKFRIYVNEKDFFMLNDTFPDFSKVNNIDWEDEKNEYTLFLKAMYVLSYLGGMSIQNLKSENNLARSFAYFYFYYHLKKFMNYRNFAGFDFSPLEKVELFKSLYFWTWHKVHFHPHMRMGDKEFKRNKDDIIANVEKEGNWVKWESRGKKRNLKNDYKKLISNKGRGLTKLGQVLFQESTQTYVYAVLGAQAKTRWKIIGDGANSFQTQGIFKTLVEEILANNNLSNLIKSMRLAISQTKVRLDFCISPGLELVPSRMIYIKDSPGYNNILLISNSDMKFGTNNSINSIEKRVVKQIKDEKQQIPDEKKQIVKLPNYSSENQTPASTIIPISFVSALVLRFLWLAL